MISIETFFSYTLACALIILSPGPDNLLAIARGLSQGKLAAFVTSLGAGCGVIIHVLTAAFGLAALIKTSTIAFTAVKIIGAIYLIYLGVNAIRSRDLISFSKTDVLPYSQIFKIGFLTSALNPKPFIFIMAFIPQFISQSSSNILQQYLVLGCWLIILAIGIFSLLGFFATFFAKALNDKPRFVLGLNISAGLAFIAAGLSIAYMS